MTMDTFFSFNGSNWNVLYISLMDERFMDTVSFQEC